MSKKQDYENELHDLYNELKSATTDERRLLLNRRINFLSFVILKIERQEKLDKEQKSKKKAD